MADNVIELQVKVNSETGQLEVVNQKLKETGNVSEKTAEGFSTLTKAAIGLVAGYAGLQGITKVISFMKDSVREAEEENEALRKLKFNLESVGISFAENEQKVKSWAAAIQASTRFSDTQAFESLQRFVKVTNTLTEAQTASKLAIDIAAASGKELNSVQEILFQLLNGNERAVRQARNEFGRMIDITDTNKEVLEKLVKAYDGAAEKEDSFSKTTAQLTNNMSDLKEVIGMGVIPIINDLFKSFLVPKEIDSLAKYIKSLEEAGVPVEEELRLLQQEIENTQFVIDDARKQLGMNKAEKNEFDPKKSQAQIEAEKKELNERWDNFAKFYRNRADLSIEVQNTELELNKEIKKSEEQDRKEKSKADIKQAKEFTKLQEDVSRQLASDFSKAFADAIISGKSFGETMEKVFDGITSTIIQAIVQMVIFKSIASAVGNPAGFGGFLPWGGRASGGPVDAGGTYIVGEEGPEILKMGNSSGQIIPNNKISRVRSGATEVPGGNNSGITNIYVTLSTNTLDLSNADFIMGKLAEEIAKKTNNSIKVAGNLANLSNKNANLAV